MRSLLNVLALLSIVSLMACSSDKTPTGPVTPPNLDGITTMQITSLTGVGTQVGFADVTIACAGPVPVSFDMNVNGTTFTGAFGTGTIACTFDGDSIGNVDWASGLAGTRTNNALEFVDSFDFCVYKGTLKSTGVSNGTVLCTESGADYSTSLTGSWTMGSPS